MQRFLILHHHNTTNYYIHYTVYYATIPPSVFHILYKAYGSVCFAHFSKKLGWAQIVLKKPLSGFLRRFMQKKILDSLASKTILFSVSRYGYNNECRVDRHLYIFLKPLKFIRFDSKLQSSWRINRYKNSFLSCLYGKSPSQT